jgi:methionyl-tRNA formyltransferase
MSTPIVIATPHRRYDRMVERLARLGTLDVTRIERQEDLNPERLTAIGPAYVFMPHWSWLIPAEVHRNFECVIFHMTDLPYGRGGSPLQNLIVRGHQQTQLSALRCEQDLDAGPVYMKRPLSLLGTAEEIFLRAQALMEDMIPSIALERPAPVAQQGEPTLFSRLGPESGDLARVDSIEAAFDRIRMLDADGYPKAHVDCGALRFEFTRASLTHDGIVADVRIRRKEDE